MNRKSVELVDISWSDIHKAANEIVSKCQNLVFKKPDFIIGVARGGIIPAHLVAEKLRIPLKIVDSFAVGCLKDFSKKKVVLIDEIYDTGATSKFFDGEAKRWGVKLTQYFVVDKRKLDKKNQWFVFPWETTGDEVGGRRQATVAILRSIGENPLREGLVDTPDRVARMWDELSSGYQQDYRKILKATFSPDNYDEMIVLKKIPFFSLCEHHLLPFRGEVSFAYIPSDKIVGVSKIARLVEMFSRRIQIQERMTMQIGKAFEDTLKPKGVGVVVEAVHFCMMMRGVEKADATMKTSYLSGIFRESDSTRSEFFRLLEK